MVLVYNRRLFREAGVPEPREGWKLREFRAAAEKLARVRADGTRQFGLNFVNWTPFWVMWLWNHGGGLVAVDGGDVIVDHAESIAGLNSSPGSRAIG